MIEANMTYLWQMPCGVDVKAFYASVPAPLSRTQSEFSLAWANEMSASKQDTGRPPLALGRPIAFANLEGNKQPLVKTFLFTYFQFPKWSLTTSFRELCF